MVWIIRYPWSLACGKDTLVLLMSLGDVYALLEKILSAVYPVLQK